MKLHRLITGLLLAATAMSSPLDLDVRERLLSNGLKVLVLADHDIPNVALYIPWRVGSRNERPGITGLAHFFEHMMFTGGARFGTSFDPTMESAGGSNNAYTTRDVTVYTDWFPASQLPLILDMEADRMKGMVFQDEVVESERGVVASERRLNMDDPEANLSEQLWAAAFTAHPYQWPVLGWMVDIENWRKEDLEEFYRVNYSPQNATVVIVGDVDPEKVFELVEAKMGSIPRGPDRRPIHTLEPPQSGERRVTLVHPSANLGQVKLAWPIPETSHPDFAVLEVLEDILLAGESSRLHRLLVEEERVVLQVGGGWQDHQFQTSLFTVEAKLREGKSADQVLPLIEAQLAELLAKGPEQRELQKVKNGIEAAFLRRLRTIDEVASVIAETETFFGGWRNLGKRLEAIQKVQPEDIQRVLREYFVTTHRTTAILEVKS